MSDNLELWSAVEKTDPAYTKLVTIPYQYTAICPHYQVKKATKRFGLYGEKWGFKTIEIDTALALVNGLVIIKGLFFFPGGEFEIINSTSVWRDGKRTKPDDQFAKKAETDMLTKALSKLGFNADVFLGKFDDNNYVNERKEEAAEEKAEDKTKSATIALQSCKKMDELKNRWSKFVKFNPELVDKLTPVKDEMKEKLNDV